MANNQDQIGNTMMTPRLKGIAFVVVALIVTAFVIYLIATGFA